MGDADTSDIGSVEAVGSGVEKFEEVGIGEVVSGEGGAELEAGLVVAESGWIDVAGPWEYGVVWWFFSVELDGREAFTQTS